MVALVLWSRIPLYSDCPKTVLYVQKKNSLLFEAFSSYIRSTPTSYFSKRIVFDFYSHFHLDASVLISSTADQVNGG